MLDLDLRNMLLNVPNFFRRQAMQHGEGAAVPAQHAINPGEAFADEFDATILPAGQGVEYLPVKNKDAAYALRAVERVIQARVVGEP
jgi:hypothetical protein